MSHTPDIPCQYFITQHNHFQFSLNLSFIIIFPLLVGQQKTLAVQTAPKNNYQPNTYITHNSNEQTSHHMHKASGASFPSCIMWWGNPILIKDESRNVAAGGGSTCWNSWSRKWESSSITPNRPPVSRHSLRQTWTSAAKAITEHRTPWAFKFWENKKRQSLHKCSQMQRIRAITFVTWPTATV